MNKNKICKLCKEEKSKIEFYKLSSPKYKNDWDCRDSFCKQCRRDYATERRQKTKSEIIKYFGGKCNDCGFQTDIQAVYDVHHLDSSKKTFNFSDVSKSFESLKDELSGCILLCANCHRIRHN